MVRLTVSSGSVTINEDSSVQILAEEAVPVEDLDAKVSSNIFMNFVSISMY